MIDAVARRLGGWTWTPQAQWGIGGATERVLAVYGNLDRWR